MNGKKPLLVLVGPTAVGKTSLSINVAKGLSGEIISADSMQIYKHMDIGTAKIKDEEKQGIQHHLINVVEPDQGFSVSDFKDQATDLIDKIITKGHFPMIVGGTGLYVNSMVYDLDFTKAVSNWTLRKKYEDLALKHGNDYIMKELERIDPKSADRIHINDRKRIIRALEVYYETGKPMTEYYQNFRKPNPNYDLVMIGLTMDRKKLYDRINQRVDLMMEEGLVDEVKHLLQMGYSSDAVALQGLGYKEVIAYLKGDYTLEEAVYLLKRDTRRFAKRQLTWFRRDKRINWIHVEDFNNKGTLDKHIIDYTSQVLKSNEIYNHIVNGGDSFEKQY